MRWMDEMMGGWMRWVDWLLRPLELSERKREREKGYSS